MYGSLVDVACARGIFSILVQPENKMPPDHLSDNTSMHHDK